MELHVSPSPPLPLPPPEGVIVLYPDGTWTEEDVCPPELVEETAPNNWRFCRDPGLRDRIPSLWVPPINGIPYHEVEEIFEDIKDALMAIDGVSTVVLGGTSIEVYTAKPGLVPEEVEGIPIITLPPFFATTLSDTLSTTVRPLKGGVGISSPHEKIGYYYSGTLTAVALAAGEPWLVLPAHLLKFPQDDPPCPIEKGKKFKKLHECPKYGGSTRTIQQPPKTKTNVGRATRWDIVPWRSRTPLTLDVAAAFADTDTDATKVYRPRLVSPNIFRLWSSV